MTETTENAILEDELNTLADEAAQRDDRLRDLIGRIERREEKLSHSSFNSFCKSPLHFISYKLRERETTPAMIFGSMVHCLILEPDEFDKRYFIAPKCDRRTKAGKAIWAETLAIAGDRELTKQEDYDKALKIKKRVYSNDASGWVMSQITETERAVEWKFGGYDWRGYIDGIGENVVLDLKKVVDASPRKVERLIKYEGYGRQAAHYLRAVGNPDLDFYFICFDENANVSVHKMTRGALAVEYEQIDFYMGKFQLCAFKNDWNKSFDFYAPNGGIFEIR